MDDNELYTMLQEAAELSWVWEKTGQCKVDETGVGMLIICSQGEGVGEGCKPTSNELLPGILQEELKKTVTG
jgi:hypothetical protein